METYSEIISVYAKDSPNNYRLENFSVSHIEESRVCGDDIEVFLRIVDSKIVDYSFIGNTSIITKAAASIFGESIIGTKIDVVCDYKIDYILDLIGDVSPRRRYAASLGLLATRNAILKYTGRKPNDDFSDVLE